MWPPGPPHPASPLGLVLDLRVWRHPGQCGNYDPAMHICDTTNASVSQLLGFHQAVLLCAHKTRPRKSEEQNYKANERWRLETRWLKYLLQTSAAVLETSKQYVTMVTACLLLLQVCGVQCTLWMTVKVIIEAIQVGCFDTKYLFLIYIFAESLLNLIQTQT